MNNIVFSRIAVCDSSEKFQLTESTKSFDSAPWQLYAFHLLLSARGFVCQVATSFSRKPDTSVACLTGTVYVAFLF